MKAFGLFDIDEAKKIFLKKKNQNGCLKKGFELCLFTVLSEMMRLEIFNERLARH